MLVAGLSDAGWLEQLMKNIITIAIIIAIISVIVIIILIIIINV